MSEKTEKQKEKEAKKKAEKAEKLERLRLKQLKVEEQKKASGEGDKTSKKDEKTEGKSRGEEKVKSSATYDESLSLPSGMKNVNCPLPDGYSPQYVEAAWYSWWEKSGFFKPEYGTNSVKEMTKKAKGGQNVFTMVIPPPNVTGKLHIGHALTMAVEDAITRWHRMNGKVTLWNPGCDHAGIATQVVVEKKLKKEQGISRHDLGREGFVNKVWEWKEEYGAGIYDQLRKIGTSVDWERACFTLDPKMKTAVEEAFIRMHEDGTIYRSNRLVNWSCTLNSAISNLEVDKVELPGRTLMSVPGYKEKVEFGVLISFAYKVENSSEEIVVATTRIETMLGDTGVAVHPNDARYKNFHGKYVLHPFCKDEKGQPRRLPVVCDDVLVDMAFGTGAVKITPAHDENDYECGKRHKLPFLTIFTDDGNVAEGYGQFSNMPRFNARIAVMEALEKIGLFRGKVDNAMSVPVCNRSKDIIEPLLKPQWYVRCDDMAKKAVEAVQNGDLKVLPQQFEKTWYGWMDGIRDWCISRQLWWGHRIPVYLVSIPGKQLDPNHNDSWVTGRTIEEAKNKAARKFKVEGSTITLTQDEDVLDTWFSSALFPFSIFGWPEESEELKLFYPGALLETGHDILFFWVARMVFFGQKLMGKLPFKEIFLHAMVRDAHGRKMSKSLGNVIDPLNVVSGISLEELQKTLEGGNLDQNEVKKAQEGQKIDYPNGIPECGTDALRFALCAYTAQGRDINLDILRVQGYRFFCNKLWNATKFAMMYLGGFRPKADCILNLLKSGKAKESKNNELYDPLPTEEEMKTPSGMETLNSCLKGSEYLSGLQATQVDAVAFKSYGVDLQPSYWKYKHLAVWYHRMNTLSTEELDKLPNGPGGVVRSKPAPLTSMDRWILSRMSFAVDMVNEGFEKYNFPQATTALYNFWLYELCDVYLEYLKPVFQWGAADSVLTARHVLTTCLDTGLRLISPIMPFISEELYQRLPGQKDHPSICVSSYPTKQQNKVYRNEDIEKDVKFVQKVIDTVRSTRADYNLPSKTKTDIYLRVFDDKPMAECLTRYSNVIATLAYSSKVLVVCAEDKSISLPDGCAIVTVSDKVAAHLMLKGIIDAAKEVEKLEKKSTQLKNQYDKLIKAQQVQGYDTKVPEDIRLANTEKCQQTQKEVERLVDAIAALKTL